MKKSIFITGIAGSGKSTLSKKLNNLGYESYGIEDDVYGLFMFIRKDTGERYMDYDNTDMSKVNNARWICDIDKLKKLLNEQKNDVAFYCGTASNKTEVMTVFVKTILLKVKPEILNKRLMVREGTDNYANTAAGRQRVLNGVSQFESEIIKAGGIAVDANSDHEEVAKEVIKYI